MWKHAIDPRVRASPYHTHATAQPRLKRDHSASVRAVVVLRTVERSSGICVYVSVCLYVCVYLSQN